MNQLWIDDRYTGKHGIGRYAQEVVPRLTVTWKSLGVSGKPAAPRDLVTNLRHVGPGDAIYSPGYAAFPGRSLQVLTVHDLIHLTVRGSRALKYRSYYSHVVRPAVRRAGAVITVSETSKRAIREWLKDDSVTVINAGNACSAAFFPREPQVNLNSPYLLFVGNLRSHKNPDIAVRSVAAMDGFRLRMLVPSDEAEATRRLAELHGVSDRVEVLHNLSDEALAEQYRAAAATILPSSLEGFGLPALESVSCGTPVVYWSGCSAIDEAARGYGYAVEDLADASGWVDAISRAAAAGNIAPVPAPSWDDVAARVQQVLVSALPFEPAMPTLDRETNL